MDFDVQVVHSVQEIGQEAWDCLGRGRAFTSYRWYRFGETVLSDDTPVYIILSQGGEAVARATFWLIRQEPLFTIPSKIGRGLVQAMIHRWPLFICRSPLSSSSGLILPDPPLREAALKVLAQVAQEQARRYRASFIVFDYLDSHAVAEAGWPDTFMSMMIPGPGTRLVIVWSEFESYLSQLPKSVRSDYRRHRNRAANLGIEIKCHSQVTRLDEALALIHNVETHHHTAPIPWTRMVFANAHMIDATWLTAEIEGRLVGCGLLLKEGDFAFLTSLGRDYSVEYVYFQLVYAGIGCAIEQGVRVLRGGSEAYQLKHRLGFQEENNNHVIYTTNNCGLRWLSRWLNV